MYLLVPAAVRFYFKLNNQFPILHINSGFIVATTSLPFLPSATEHVTFGLHVYYHYLKPFRVKSLKQSGSLQDGR